MFEWQKLGHVFDPTKVTGRTWLKQFAQAPSALVLERTIRIYFSCRPEPDNAGQYVSYSAWVELDREDLTKVIRVAERPILFLILEAKFFRDLLEPKLCASSAIKVA